MERLDLFMARANAAYYAGHDPFADFTTAPEISQAFGEVLGAWAAIVWDSMGRPDPVILAEAGPGRGTLMADALRAVARVAPDFRSALRLHLVDTSPRLRAVQAAALPGAVWHDRVEDLPDGPLILLGNEFLDALPIRQFVQREDGWAERFVQDGEWVECPTSHPPPPFAGEVAAQPTEGAPPAAPAVPGPPPPRFARSSSPAEDAGEDDGASSSPALGGGGGGAADGGGDPAAPAAPMIIETRDPSLAEHLGARFRQHPGAALFLDYGPMASGPGDSLQALRDGKPADPLAEPGAADLTAHVDFTAFARHSGLPSHGPLPQGKFLTRLGLFARIDRLAGTRPPMEAHRMIQAGRRLAEPDRMGALFKALALTSPGLPVPPGFEE